jgi:SAM-dependent methyltransferase
MDVPEYMIDFHRVACRQGPGSDASTRRALNAVPNADSVTSILDLGSGTGAQSLVLARETGASVTAVDVVPQFLEELEHRAAAADVGDRISTVDASMDDLHLPVQSFELLWSECSAYTIGFDTALRYWRRFLVPGGHLVVSELCWLTDSRPQQAEKFWAQAYPDMTTVQSTLASIEAAGYTCLEHFALPPEAWRDGYYRPIRQRSTAFLEAYGNSAEVAAFIAAGLEEAQIYDDFGEHYSYVFFVLAPQT